MARAAALPTTSIRISENRQILILDRFDRNASGEHLGIEDFCVLTGRRSHGRYDGSYENIAKRIGQFVSTEYRQAACEQLFLMLAYACAIENGDAHLKNFSVLYDRPDDAVRLAPAYDLVCTRVYQPHDSLALTLDATKQFPERGTLVKFARTSLNLASRCTEELLDRAGDGASRALALAQAFDYRENGKRFVAAFTNAINRGLNRSIIDHTKAISLP